MASILSLAGKLQFRAVTVIERCDEAIVPRATPSRPGRSPYRRRDASLGRLSWQPGSVVFSLPPFPLAPERRVCCFPRPSGTRSQTGPRAPTESSASLAPHGPVRPRCWGHPQSFCGFPRQVLQNLAERILRKQVRQQPRSKWYSKRCLQQRLGTT